MAAGDRRESASRHETARETATGHSAAEEETIPPANWVRSEPSPDVVARSLELPKSLGRYEVEKCLGRGAMGAVFLAHDTEIDRKVALKVPLGDTSEGSEWLQRFRREARAAGALRHANICPIYDVAEIDGFHLIAMAFVEGSPLSTVIASGKKVPIRKAVQVVRKIASALADAHDQKIIHRDLKPANIMIDGKGEPIVMDFGLARHVTVAGGEQLTREGDVAGSPAYMSPEQFEGRPEAIGPASDIYSLGVILFELLTGEIPFRGSMMEIMAQILKKPVPAPSTLREDVDRGLDQICRKMTARKEADRFGSMKSVVKALSEFLKADTEARSESAPAEATTEEDLKQIDRACRKADRLVDEYKYEAAIDVLSNLPERLKTSRVRDLLLDAMDLKRQFDGLLAAVEEDLDSYEHPERLFRKARRLMQLRPNHRRAREIFDEVTGARSKLPLRIRRSWQKGQFYIIAGKTVHLSVLVGIFLGIAGAVTAGLWTAFVTVPTEDGLVQIEADPTLSVKVDGETFSTARLGKPLRFSAGTHTLIVEQDGREISTSSFAVIEGETLQLNLSLLAGELVLEKNGVVTTVPIEIQTRPPPGAVASVETPTKPRQVTQPRPGTSKPKPPPIVAAADLPQGDLMLCGNLSTDGPPVGMNPAAIHFTSNANSRNGFQFLIPGWRAWSANEWQFQMTLGGSAGRGCFVIQPVRFGHLTVKIRQDGCDVFMMRQWPDPDMVAHASVKTSAAGDIFPLERGRAYLVSSRIDELGDYVLSIDGKTVLKSLLPLVREYIVDGRAMRGLPPGPVRPMAFSSASRFKGDGLHLKWPPGSGGVVVDYATEGTISASNVHLTLTTPTSTSPVVESLKKGLVVWYPLDNVRGRTVTDASGNDNNGAASGDLRPVPGISGGGAAIDDETLITVGEVAAFDWNRPFTLSGWIRPEALDGTRYVFRKRNESAKGYTLMLRRVTLGFGAASGIGGNMLGMYADKGAIMLRQWSHVAVVYDGSGRKLSIAMYVDGRQVRYENTSGTLSASMTVPDPLRIGRAFVGQLDDLRVYDRMLTNEEITFLAAPDRN